MGRSLDRLLEIMARLRDPEHGCPWDCEQDFSTIAPYTIEEAYEVADAIARRDTAALTCWAMRCIWHWNSREHRPSAIGFKGKTAPPPDCT